jgi:signal transduction histidine kinase
LAVSSHQVLDTLSPAIIRPRTASVRRIAGGGLIVALLAAAAGGTLELVRFGRTDAAAAAALQARVRAEFAGMIAQLRQIAGDVAADPAVPRAMVGADQDASPTLFDITARALPDPDASRLAITIYSTAAARAWAGRPSDIALDRINGPSAVFATPSPLGLRLVYVDPILTEGRDRARIGAVAVEHVLSPAPAASTITASEYVMPTPLAPVSLRVLAPGTAAPDAAGTFTIADPDGRPLLAASVDPADLSAARQRWRARVRALVTLILGLTLWLMTGPLLDRRSAAPDTRTDIRLSVAITALLLAGAALMWLALVTANLTVWRDPARLLLAGVTGTAVAATLVRLVARLRVASRHGRRPPSRAPAMFVLQHVACGVVIAVMFAAFERFLQTAVDPASADVRHFSLNPWDAPRIVTLIAIVLCHAAVLWAGAMACVASLASWRLPRRVGGMHVAVLGLWILPAAALAAASIGRGWPIPASALLLDALAAGAAAVFASHIARWYRLTTVASRILALFMALLLPALLLYPSVHFFAERATQELIADRYAVEAMRHPQALQDRLNEALREIDALPFLPELVGGPLDVIGGGPRTDAAFAVWSRTVLARARLTSGIELYDRSNGLVSRFALNFPEYTGVPQQPQGVAGCRWDVWGEAQPFGSEERRMLHAERNICANGVRAGTIVVHVVFDYRTLPFITSQSPYFEIFRSAAGGGGQADDSPASEVEVVIYGWGLRPIYSSGRSAWPLDEDVFARAYASRAPFWTTLRKQDVAYHVYVSNDRAGIYAIGYPAAGVFDHLVRLAELTTLAGLVYVAIVIAAVLFARIARGRPRVGRALLREIRVSFYRKLFLAFVLASIVPVLTLAFVIRAYFAGLLRADVEAEAARTAAVAQRVIEESDALLRRGTATLAPLGDDVLVWISQVIDQDVNVFDGPRLWATSERDLFASGLLPTRTPDDVYRAIVLERLPSFVGNDSIGTFSYMLAAAPVRAGGRDAVLTVPLATRQQEIEREIDDLDRGVHLAALFFILLGAGIGLSMAERIADPVSRLTRATRRIARGDFDARIAVRSSDELQRLVDAFNSMAGELKAQRAQLERTHRIEAWAEMARQVAHEIKNPLTPIQLSAEHLRRVHADRGEPLSPVLEGCVEAILGQVTLLRQIAGEFSSFASSPTARPAPVDPVELVRGVVEPYRPGLAGRIGIDNAVQPPLPRVFVDRTLVARALANVVENALHAMPGTGRIALTAGVDEGFVWIQVQDSGVGMDADALARVFEPYFSTKTTGTGLGLPIARRNIELNGGSVAVVSAKGQGTTVTIRLPVAVESAA